MSGGVPEPLRRRFWTYMLCGTAIPYVLPLLYFFIIDDTPTSMIAPMLAIASFAWALATSFTAPALHMLNFQGRTRMWGSLAIVAIATPLPITLMQLIAARTGYVQLLCRHVDIGLISWSEICAPWSLGELLHIAGLATLFAVLGLLSTLVAWIATFGGLRPPSPTSDMT